MSQDARRVVIDDFNITDERGARVETLEKVVRQEGVFRHASLEGRLERVHVVEALAGEDALGEQVLIDVRYRGGVGIDANVARICPREG